MDPQGDLGRLEAIIEQLLASFGELKKENRAVAAKLAERERALAALEEENQQLKKEKNQVYQRVAGLISALEKWEQVDNSSNDADEPSDEKSSTVSAGGSTANASFGLGS